MAKAAAADNFHTVKPSDAVALLTMAIQSQSSAFFWGAPGIGKSDIIRQIASGLGYHLEDIRLSQMDPCDIRGIPYKASREVKNPETQESFRDDEGNPITEDVLEWAMADFLKRAEQARKGLLYTDENNNPVSKPTIFFFDEMNSAPQTIQAAAYQIVLDRRIGNFYLGADDAVIAAGNRESDKGVTYKMPTPLANRFFHVELHVDFQDWQDWAVQSRVLPEVIGFLSAFKDKLHQFSPAQADRAFATPRSWARVSQMLAKGNLPDSLITEAVAGAVGSGVATEFIAHRRIAHKLPSSSDVLEGRAKKLQTDEVSAQYCLVTSLCYDLNERFQDAKGLKAGNPKADSFLNCVDNFLEFMMNNFSKELVVMGMRAALKTYKISFATKGMKSWDRFFKEYGSLISDSIS